MPTQSPARQWRAPQRDQLVRALMDDAQHGALLLDPQGRLAEANAAAERLLGFSLARQRGKPAGAMLADRGRGRRRHP